MTEHGEGYLHLWVNEWVDLNDYGELFLPPILKRWLAKTLLSLVRALHMSIKD